MKPEILVSMIIWTALTLLLTLKDETAEDVRLSFVFMVLCYVIFNSLPL